MITLKLAMIVVWESIVGGERKTLVRIVLLGTTPKQRVKVLVCPAFPVNFKMCPVNLRVNSALKIRKVKNQIRPNAIPVALVKDQKKAVLNALNVRLEERALAAKSV